MPRGMGKVDVGSDGVLQERVAKDLQPLKERAKLGRTHRVALGNQHPLLSPHARPVVVASPALQLSRLLCFKNHFVPYSIKSPDETGTQGVVLLTANLTATMTGHKTLGLTLGTPYLVVHILVADARGDGLQHNMHQLLLRMFCCG